jgi:[ribosomal protein S18]-alanine N-acetyltransferase
MIRPFEMKDIAFIRSYEGQMLGQSMSIKTIEEATLLRKDARYFIFEDKEPKGYIGLHVDEDQIDIATLYVPEPFRQKGVATQLLEYGINFAQHLQLKRITLEVSEHNFPALHLYEKYGFMKRTVRKNYYPDQSDAWLMIKELS